MQKIVYLSFQKYKTLYIDLHFSARTNRTISFMIRSFMKRSAVGRLLNNDYNIYYEVLYVLLLF